MIKTEKKMLNPTKTLKMKIYIKIFFSYQIDKTGRLPLHEHKEQRESDSHMLVEGL